MKLFTSMALILAGIAAAAQQTPKIKFGKIAAADLEQKIYSVDSNANAVVIADIGKSEFLGNNKGWFSLQFTHFKRVHILKKSGYAIADIEIPLYVSDGNEERLVSVKAVTYNLENGRVVQTKLDKSGVFTDKYDKNHILKKFTFPNVKEGSVIEYEYVVTSDFLFNLQPWEFQGKAPHLWSEYNVSLPNFFGYIFLSKGYHPFYIKDSKERQQVYNIHENGGTGPSENYAVTSGVVDYKWAMKDVPELKEESFTSTMENHKSKIEFQLSAFREPLVPKQIIQTWPQVTKELMEDEDFGQQLNNANNWLNDDVKLATAGATTDLEKAKKIFAYVRDNIQCTSHNALYKSQSLREVMKSKKGKVSDVNLLLTAMLRNAGISADPVLLSTRDHGVTYALYPIISQYNYVICQVTVDGVNYDLDASNAGLGFGKLPVECYNSTARVINQEAKAINLIPDSLHENKFTMVFLLNGENGKWSGNLNQTLGDYESYTVRNKIKEQGVDGFLKEIKKAYNNELEIENPTFDSLTQYENPVKIHYDFNMKADEDIIYFNPMFAEGQKENPFKSAERLYPVEMPYVFDETFVLSLEVPKGYMVDELPKSIRVKLNEEGEGEFEYIIAESNGMVSLRSRLKFTRATFQPEEYAMLREFFNLVVKKHSEQIVFKKKK